MLYAVCTQCPFLRAYSRGGSARAPDACPACGGELMVRESEGRFPPTYVSRVTFELMRAPELEASGAEPSAGSAASR